MNATTHIYCVYNRSGGNKCCGEKYNGITMLESREKGLEFSRVCTGKVSLSRDT